MSLAGSNCWGERRLLNTIWFILVLASILWAGFQGQESLAGLTKALFDGAKGAVNIVIGMLGAMMFMLGIMRVAFDGGLRDLIARLLAPVLRRLFPDVPPEHPAMGAMVMNFASNVLGLGNAATPFGLKAMAELNKLNRHPGVASDSMVLFLAINTSAITLLLPTGTIAVRAAANSATPEAIWIPTLIATSCSTLAAITAVLLLKRVPFFRIRPLEYAEGEEAEDLSDETIPDPADQLENKAPTFEPIPLYRKLILLAVILAFVGFIGLDAFRLSQAGSGAFDIFKTIAQSWAFPLLIAGCLLFGYARGVRIYDSMIEGAKEGLEVALRITPYLVAILAAVALFRASGLLDTVVIPLLQPLIAPLGVPAEVLPMALLRPLSGSGAFGLMSEIVNTHGPDSWIGLLTSTLQGSTETTFYVLALYFGAARIREGRHALFACLIGDLAGFLGAVFACHLFFGN